MTGGAFPSREQGGDELTDIGDDAHSTLARSGSRKRSGMPVRSDSRNCHIVETVENALAVYGMLGYIVM